MDVPAPEEQKKADSGVGPIAGIIIIVLLLLAGGIYFLMMETSKNEQAPTGESQASL